MTASPEPIPAERHQHIIDYDKRRQKRADRLFHWSLDMPPEDEDVDVRVNKQQGIGWKELAVIAATGLGGAWLLLPQLLDKQQPPSQQGPVDSAYEVRFYDKDGNPIDVPHISQR